MAMEPSILKATGRENPKKKSGNIPRKTKLHDQHTVYRVKLFDDNPCIIVEVAKEEFFNLKFLSALGL
jgi:hypothetical protein